MIDEDTDNGLDPIVQEAQKRFKRCYNWESDAWKHFINDTKFANADSTNGWQWPGDIYKDRNEGKKPCLTINKTRQHNLQIINDAKQNKPGIAIRATGNGATFESAQALSSLVRYIERKSKAQVAYDTATVFQVNGGIGYLRVATDYCDQKTTNQDIFIRRVPDPKMIYMDPDAREADKSDSMFAFAYEDLPKEEIKLRFKKYGDLGTQSPLGYEDGMDWVKEDHVRVCEYFRKVKKEDELLVIQTPQGPVLVKASKLDKQKLELAIDDPQTLRRTIEDTVVEYYLIIGCKVVEKKKWPGKYIPLVPVIGEETIIDGKMDRKGHTRAMIDPQRMYNYWTSAAVEHVALQGKTPWVGSADAIEGYEVYYNNANKNNYSVLLYNAYDDQGRELKPPIRIDPPMMAPAYMQGMQIASDEVMAVSGQYQAQMGQPGNERSGKAIGERQRQGDNSTYHYIDNLAVAIRQVGNIILDLIPIIYDTERVLMVMAEDGTDFEIMINPKAQKAFEMKRDNNGKIAQRILNPKVGEYDVEADVGPAYATRREEAFNAFTLILTQAPEMAAVIGDLLLQAGDFPMADEAAARLKRMVPPQALGEGPSQAETQLTGQVQQLTKLLNTTMEQLAVANLKLKGKDELRDINAFNAVTQRLKAEWDAMADMGMKVITPHQLAGLVQDTLGEAKNIGLEPAVNAALPLLRASASGGSPNMTGTPFGGPQ